jgi:manganese/iron transport system permease protein
VDLIGALPDPADLLELRTMRLAAGELALLGIAGGLTGAFVVLRRLAFFSHAVGTATFPGVVVADAASLSPRLAALAVALAYGGATERAGRGGRDAGDTATALVLVGALGVGIVLASDVFESGAAVDRLLFGSAVALDEGDLLFAAAAAALSAAGAALLGRAWTAASFDPGGAPALGLPLAKTDLALLSLVALVAAAALPAVGALLVSSLLAVPAAIGRLLTRSVGGLLRASVAIALAQGLLGLYGSLWLDIPPGPAVAVLGAAGYGAVALVLGLRGPAALAPEAA